MHAVTTDPDSPLEQTATEAGYRTIADLDDHLHTSTGAPAATQVTLADDWTPVQ